MTGLPEPAYQQLPKGHTRQENTNKYSKAEALGQLPFRQERRKGWKESGRVKAGLCPRPPVASSPAPVVPRAPPGAGPEHRAGRVPLDALMPLTFRTMQDVCSRVIRVQLFSWRESGHEENVLSVFGICGGEQREGRGPFPQKLVPVCPALQAEEGLPACTFSPNRTSWSKSAETQTLRLTSPKPRHAY